MDDALQKNLLLNTVHFLDGILLQLESATGGLEVDAIVCKIESAVTTLSEFCEFKDSAIPWIQDTISVLERGIVMLSEVEKTRNPRLGRSRLLISYERLEYLLSLHFKVPDIATMLSVSRRTIFHRFQEYGLSVSDTYSRISNDQLHLIVEQKILEFPNTGYKRMRGFLLAAGIRVTEYRVREAMRVVDPTGVMQRLRLNRALVRRQYSVPFSNFIWHIDGNHKLIHWKIIVRAGIDGFSRLITYIQATGDNRADTHLHGFMGGVQRFGVPLHCRRDKGGENVDIARFMIENQGSGRRSHICGRSVHNQRIERLWRDVFFGCLSFYYEAFTKIELDRNLEVDNPKHIAVLHKIFLPRLNRSLDTFCHGWNFHPLSGVGNYSPAQLFIRNLPPAQYDILPETMAQDDKFLEELHQLNEFDTSSPLLHARPQSCFSETELDALTQIDPLAVSNTYGYDIFMNALSCVQVHI